MLKGTRILIPAFVVMALVGCEQSASITGDDGIAGPAFNTSPPAESGVVTRGQTGWGTTLVDTGSGLRSVLGVSIKDFCQGTGSFSVVDFMEVATGAGNTVNHQSGEVYAEVWPAGPFDCAVFLASDPIATGTVHVVRTDNDIYLDGGRMNAYGWRANGTLHDANGAAYRFSEVITLQWPDGASGSVTRNLRVSLHPIG